MDIPSQQNGNRVNVRIVFRHHSLDTGRKLNVPKTFKKQPGSVYRCTYHRAKVSLGLQGLRSVLHTSVNY